MFSGRWVSSVRGLALGLTLVALAVVGTGCPHNPPGGIPTDGAGGAAPVTQLACASGVAQSAIADAISRIDTVIASGVTQGAVEATIIKNLEGLAVDLGPQAFACAMQYVAAKLDYDANHGTSSVAADKAYESQVARDYVTGHPAAAVH